MCAEYIALGYEPLARLISAELAAAAAAAHLAAAAAHLAAAAAYFATTAVYLAAAAVYVAAAGNEVISVFSTNQLLTNETTEMMGMPFFLERPGVCVTSYDKLDQVIPSSALAFSQRNKRDAVSERMPWPCLHRPS